MAELKRYKKLPISEFRGFSGKKAKIKKFTSDEESGEIRVNNLGDIRFVTQKSATSIYMGTANKNTLEYNISIPLRDLGIEYIDVEVESEGKKGGEDLGNEKDIKEGKDNHSNKGLEVGQYCYVSNDSIKSARNQRRKFLLCGIISGKPKNGSYVTVDKEEENAFWSGQEYSADTWLYAVPIKKGEEDIVSVIYDGDRRDAKLIKKTD